MALSAVFPFVKINVAPLPIRNEPREGVALLRMTPAPAFVITAPSPACGTVPPLQFAPSDQSFVPDDVHVFVPASESEGDKQAVRTRAATATPNVLSDPGNSVLAIENVRLGCRLARSREICFITNRSEQFMMLYLPAR